MTERDKYQVLRVRAVVAVHEVVETDGARYLQPGPPVDPSLSPAAIENSAARYVWP
jgi:hypothetical protein